jgi:hypothetical protein
VSTNRSGPLPPRTVTPNPNHSIYSSPSLSPKTSTADNIPLSPKLSPTNYPYSSAGNTYAPSPTRQRVLPTALTNESPSAPIRSFTNLNYPSAGIRPDTNSLRSEDSNTSSEEHLHPTSLQETNSIRKEDVISSPNTRYRSSHPHASVSSAGNLKTYSTNITNSSIGTTISSATGAPIERVPSPSPSVLSEREREENDRVERELEFKRKRLQVYVFICRCIACPFNSKQSSDMARKHLKVTLVQYGVIKERFLAFLNGKTHIEVDEGKKILKKQKTLFIVNKNYFSFYKCCSFIL